MSKRSAVLRRVSIVRLPLVGIIAAGKPLDNQQLEDWCSVRLPAGLRAEDHFVVRVSGDSLIGVNIQDGDYAVCRRSQQARHGQLCALLTPDGVTLKHLFIERNGWVALVSANPKFKPQLWRGEDIRVQGIVICIERD